MENRPRKNSAVPALIQLAGRFDASPHGSASCRAGPDHSETSLLRRGHDLPERTLRAPRGPLPLRDASQRCRSRLSDVPAGGSSRPPVLRNRKHENT